MCKYCHKNFNGYKHRKRNFCSQKCYFKYTIGQGNPNYKHGKKELKNAIRSCKKNRSLIIKILKRDNYTCKFCGQVGYDLHIDHIKLFSVIFREFLEKYKTIKDRNKLFVLAQKYKPFWDEHNLRVLCKKCNLNRYYKKIIS